MNELISIIVPVYNVEQYINQCIESIVNQLYNHLEIILVDDGSPDLCPQICDKWAQKDSRIKVIHKENGGLSDARNAGLKVATGKYISFIDSDDWVTPEFIERLYHAIKDNKADIAACDIEKVFDESPILRDEESMHIEVHNTEQALRYLIQGEKYCAVAWNKLYKMELIRDERFEVGKIHEDEYFTYRILAKATKTAYINSSLYYYRQRAGSIMSDFSIKHIYVLEAFYERLFYLKNTFRNLYDQDRITFCITCLNYYMASKDLEKEMCIKARKYIMDYRKKIKFTFSDIRKYSAKEKVYVIGSMPLFIDLFTIMRIVLGKNK